MAGGVGTIMTRTVVTTSPDASAADVARLLAAQGISAAPVCDDDGRPLGIISEGDLLRPFGRRRSLKRDWRNRSNGKGTPMSEHRRMLEIVRSRAPVTLPSSTTVHQAAQLMRERKVGAILITDEDGHLLGIFTGRDAVARVLAEGRSAENTALADVMTPRPDTLPAAASAIEALRLMHDGGFRHIPIAEQGRLAGIVSYGDFRGLEHARLDEETGFWEIL